MFHQFFSLNLLTSKSVVCKPEKNFLFSKASAQLKKKLNQLCLRSAENLDNKEGKKKKELCNMDFHLPSLSWSSSIYCCIEFISWNDVKINKIQFHD